MLSVTSSARKIVNLRNRVIHAYDDVVEPSFGKLL
jgi:flagellar hook-basal body complex protein FliE